MESIGQFSWFGKEEFALSSAVANPAFSVEVHRRAPLFRNFVCQNERMGNLRCLSLTMPDSSYIIINIIVLQWIHTYIIMCSRGTHMQFPFHYSKLRLKQSVPFPHHLCCSERQQAQLICSQLWLVFCHPSNKNAKNKNSYKREWNTNPFLKKTRIISGSQ